MLPFAGKTPRLSGTNVGPLTVRHAEVTVTALPTLTRANDGFGFVVRIGLGSGRGELLDTLSGEGFVSRELAVNELEQRLARWWLPKQDPGGWDDEPRRPRTARQRSDALRFRLHGY